ncbi:MAG: hypothetical protein ACRDAX_08580 [Propionibacteriaceae bacterium]
MANESTTSIAMLAPVEKAGGGIMRKLLQIAIDGGGGMPPVSQASARALQRYKDHESAISALIRQHTMLAGTQGFLTNLGGFATLPISLPSNMTGLAVLQLRLVACIAHLRGYNISDPRVRSAVMMTLLGPKLPDELPSSPLLVATAPVFDVSLDHIISEKVMTALISSVGGRRAVTLIGRRIPVVGGAVGATTDSWEAVGIGRHARSVFVARRAIR